MSTTTRSSRGKPVTLAKSAAPDVSAPKAAKSSPAKTAAPKMPAAKPEAELAETVTQAAPAPVSTAPALAAPVAGADKVDAHELDALFHTKWNDLVKAQSDAALAWWQEVKDARTVADAIAVNARHSRLQFEMAAGQAREMANFVQKTLEGNAERFRAMLKPGQR